MQGSAGYFQRKCFYMFWINNVGIAWYSTDKPPIFHGLYHPFVVIGGMVYCYTNIIRNPYQPGEVIGCSWDPHGTLETSPASRRRKSSSSSRRSVSFTAFDLAEKSGSLGWKERRNSRSRYYTCLKITEITFCMYMLHELSLYIWLRIFWGATTGTSDWSGCGRRRQ